MWIHHVVDFGATIKKTEASKKTVFPRYALQCRVEVWPPHPLTHARSHHLMELTSRRTPS
jgi:hypothetical protein